jgi:hypothetical protein
MCVYVYTYDHARAFTLRIECVKLNGHEEYANVHQRVLMQLQLERA